MAGLSVWCCGVCGQMKDSDQEQPYCLIHPYSIPLCEECYLGEPVILLLTEEVA